MSFLNPSVIAQAVPELSDVFYMKTVTSTNQYLMGYLKQEPSASGYHLAIAEGQTAGRGQRGRVWHSPEGVNVYFSLGLNECQFSPIVAGLVCAEVLEKYCQNAVQLKWPNDLFVNQRKLGGILVERQWASKTACRSVLGVGINVAMSSLPENSIHSLSSDNEWIDQPWTDLVSESGSEKVIDRTQVLIDVLQALLPAMMRYRQHGLNGFIEAWNARHLYHGQTIRFKADNQRLLVGKVMGIDHEGALLMQRDGQRGGQRDGQIERCVSGSIVPELAGAP